MSASSGRQVAGRPLDAFPSQPRLSAHIFLRPLGSPLTIGMSGLAIASLVQSGVELHWTAASQTAQAGLILIAVPFVLQLIACIFSYLARDGATGATVGVLATSWLAIGLIHMVAKPGAKSGPLGLMLLIVGGVLALSSVAVAISKPLPALVFGGAALRFAVAGVHQLGASHPWGTASGVLGLVVTGLAAYAALAFELEGQRQRAVLPTFRRGGAVTALDDGDQPPLDHLTREPGVRQST
jgi:succinate-acetate transporter protein